MPYTIGIDIGSRNTKLVVYDSLLRSIEWEEIQPTGVNPRQAVEKLMSGVLGGFTQNQDAPPVVYATGYGRKLVTAQKYLSEVSCHAAGVQHYFPSTRTVIDIGGQDSKVIAIGSNGRVKDFVMNDKCAAGTGRFLEMVALRLGYDVDELAGIAGSSVQKINLNSICVVFAETEIISMIATGTEPQDIVRAVHLSIANRILSQVNQIAWENPVVFTGGVALNHDLKAMLSQALNTEIDTPANPEITGALGAAIIAAHEN